MTNPACGGAALDAVIAAIQQEPYSQSESGVIYCGDCLEIMKGIPDGAVDLVVTDPPYGIDMDKGFEGFGGFGTPIARKRYAGDWDAERPSPEYFQNILRVSRSALIFGGNFFADLLPQGKHWVVWDKLNTMPSFGDCELIWTNVSRKSVKKVTREYNGLIGKEQIRSHPTQKPLDLMRTLIAQYAESTDIILDPFAGSGTTLVAAKQLGRKYIGIEINPDYCKIAEDRLRQGELFGGAA